MNSKRLLAIASLIDSNDVLVDIGCDHAYLDIYLIKNKLCKKAIAADISEGAISQAKTNVKKYNLDKQIKTIVSDGLTNIIDEDINTVVISGMGTKTILDILNNQKACKINKFILQSNNNLEELRILLNKRNYKLVKEIIVLENNKYYSIMQYVHGKEKLNNSIKCLGIFNKEYRTYYEYLYNKNVEILSKIPWYKIDKRIKKLALLRHINKYLKRSI